MVRRIVTGHDEHGRSAVVADGDSEAVTFGSAGGLFHLVWGTDEPANYPDAGAQPRWRGPFPPPGGCRVVVMELPPGDENDLDDYVMDGLAEFADRTRPGMHASPTTDFDIVITGKVGLELETEEVTLHPGNIAVLNGVLHRWHNRGPNTATIVAVTVGAHHAAFGAVGG